MYTSIQGKIIETGQIWMVNFPPNDQDSRQSGRRPALVTSNRENNLYSPTIQVIPLTSNLNKNIIPVHFMLGMEYGLLKTSVALSEQETTIAKSWLISLIGQLSREKMIEVDRAIRRQRGGDKRLIGLIDTINNLDTMIQDRIEVPEIDSLKITRALMMSELKSYCNYQKLNYDFITDNYIYAYAENSYKVG